MVEKKRDNNQLPLNYLNIMVTPFPQFSLNRKEIVWKKKVITCIISPECQLDRHLLILFLFIWNDKIIQKKSLSKLLSDVSRVDFYDEHRSFRE